jgi:large subunit ribosomal protein L2
MPRENDVVGEVIDLIHSPVHTAPLAKIKLPDGDTTMVVATEGVAIGTSVAIGDNVTLRPGNITNLANIPEGTAVNNVELRWKDCTLRRQLGHR